MIKGFASEMKIHYVSDLHLEFAPYDLKTQGDVLLLAGDLVCVAHLESHDDRYRPFFQQAHERYGKVYTIMGNHEYYHSRFGEATVERYREYLAQWPNIHLLDREHADLGDGIRVFGCTLWTDYREDPLGELLARRAMADYNVIGDFNTHVAQIQHDLDWKWLSSSVSRDFPLDLSIVMTHHAPSFQSVHERFRGSPINSSFATNLEEEIKFSGIHTWIHGHMHNPCHYTINATQVVCNPRGYPNELPEEAQPLEWNDSFEF